MYVVGIETSCDETSVGVVDSEANLFANVVHSQAELHAKWGGVVPEMASREHVVHIQAVVEKALQDAKIGLHQIGAVAVTNGPGLAGGLLVGVGYAKGLSYTLNVPLIGVNHMEGHIAAAWIDGKKDGYKTENLLQKKPLIALAVSGGHTEIILIKSLKILKLIGSTRDDAAGETFDKVARVMGLAYPGGPHIQALAQEGDETKIKPLPRAWLKGSDDFSFSGLKTETARRVGLTDGSKTSLSRLAKEFQSAVFEVLVTKTVAVAKRFDCSGILLVGGVAANSELRKTLQDKSPVPVVIPRVSLCTDNGAMIAMRGLQTMSFKKDGLDLDVLSSLQIER